MRCRHCNGTGEAPDKITLECITCQSKVTVHFASTAELLDKSNDVQCAECKQAKVQP